MNLGLTGAALATVIAQGVVAAFNLSYLFRQLPQCLYMGWIKDLLLPFESDGPHRYFSIRTDLRFHRLSSSSPTGSVSAMAAMMLWRYSLCFPTCLLPVQLLLQGVGDGIQPLLSFYYGAGKRHEIHYLFQKRNHQFYSDFADYRSLRIGIPR